MTKPEAGTTAWGLVEEGKEQAKNVSPCFLLDLVKELRLRGVYVRA